MDILLTIWNFIYSHFIYIIILTVILIERKTLWLALFLQPLRGGNGVTQMDELAKYLICALLVGEWISKRDPIIMGELLAGVFAIAGLKYYQSKKKTEKHELPPPEL